MSPEEVAWFAGLFEGEGCLSVQRKKYAYANLIIQMTDEDIVRRLQSLAGGRVHGPYNTQVAGHKPVWRWVLARREEVRELAILIRPWLGERRQARLDEMLRLTERSN